MQVDRQCIIKPGDVLAQTLGLLHCGEDPNAGALFVRGSNKVICLPQLVCKLKTGRTGSEAVSTDNGDRMTEVCYTIG